MWVHDSLIELINKPLTDLFYCIKVCHNSMGVGIFHDIIWLDLTCKSLTCDLTWATITFYLTWLDFKQRWVVLWLDNDYDYNTAFIPFIQCGNINNFGQLATHHSCCNIGLPSMHWIREGANSACFSNESLG